MGNGRNGGQEGPEGEGTNTNTTRKARRSGTSVRWIQFAGQHLIVAWSELEQL